MPQASPLGDDPLKYPNAPCRDLQSARYSSFEDFIFNDQIVVQDLAYLDNFDGDIDMFDVEEGLVIRKVGYQELERFLEGLARARRFPPFHAPKYAIEATYTRKKVIGTEDKPLPSESTERLYRLVTALRLFKSGVTGFNEINTAPKTPFLWGHSTGSIVEKIFVGPQYFLGKTETVQFANFWKRFSSFMSSQPRHFAIAIRRFESAYERINPADKLLDFMIAYEALFFKQGEEGEFGHKLSTRVSKLLGKTYEERKIIAEETNEFYRKRSSIVHGEEVTIPAGFVDKVESYLRDSIKTLMERLEDQDHNEIISHLDLD